MLTGCSLLLAVGLGAAPATPQTPGLHATATASGGFSVSVAGKTWLASAPSSLFVGGTERPLALGGRRAASGTDSLGSWEADLFSGMAGGGTRVEAAVRRYAGIGAVTFEVTLPDGALVPSFQHFSHQNPLRSYGLTIQR